jgi:3-hydroxymyristoyl/3-hydroxydecanoyl-(acyl carrier protein) dehydratase
MSMTSYTVLDTHPAIAGHFPGDPVVPAVVTLDHVGEALREWPGTPSMTSLLRTKFTAVLRPNEKFRVVLRSDDGKRFIFSCEKEGGMQFASGVLIAESAGDAQ